VVGAYASGADSNALLGFHAVDDNTMLSANDSGSVLILTRRPESRR
jgi:hypothetical protein